MAAEKKPTVSAIVARGRTVHTHEGAFGPGKTVELPESEVDALRLSGFLLPEDAEAQTVQQAEAAVDSPSVQTDGGPTVVIDQA